MIKELPRGITRGNGRYDFEQPMAQVLKYIKRKKTVLLHLAGFSFLACTGYTILAFVGTVLTEIPEAQHLVPHYGWFMFASGGSVMLSGKLADWLADRYGASRRFIIGIIAGSLCLPFYYVGLFAESATVALVLIGLANVISSCSNLLCVHK